LEWGEKLDDSAFLSPLLLKKDNKTVDYNCARKGVSYWGEIKKMLSIPLEKICHYTKKYVLSHQILRTSDFESLRFVKVDLLSGSCLFIAKPLFRRINFFDPNTFLYFEEDILYKKIESIGLQNYLIPSLRCIHIGAQSTSGSSKNISTYSYDSETYYFKNYCGCGKVKMFVFKYMVKWSKMWLKIYDMYKAIARNM
jgi:GT2 family glycosyltransferase